MVTFPSHGVPLLQDVLSFLASLDIGIPSPGIGPAGRSTTLDKFAMVRGRVTSRVARPVYSPVLLASGTITHGGAT